MIGLLSTHQASGCDFLSGWADDDWTTTNQRRCALALITLVILFFAILPLLPMLRGWYWPLTHETLRYGILLDHFTAAFREGILYPRWLPDLVSGYGYPQFVFYQSGFFFLALPFDLLFDHPMISSGMALVVMLSLGGAGAYNLCRRFGGPALALLGACFFLITPYVYVNVAVRGDWSELLGCMITPWAISFLIGLRDAGLSAESPLRSFFGLGLSLAAIVVSHPSVALFSAVMMCVLSLGVMISLIGERQLIPLRVFVVNASLAGLLGLLLSSTYWWPVLALENIIMLDVITKGYFVAQDHVVYPSQFFSRSWDFGGSFPGMDDKMSFQLGLPHFLLAAVGTVWAVRSRRFVFTVVAFVFYLLVIIAMLPLSSGLWALPLLETMQFPWRLLSITAVLQVLCLAGLASLLKGLGRLSLPLVVVVLALSSLWYGNQFTAVPMIKGFNAATMQYIHDKDATGLTSYSVLNEFLPRTALRITELSPFGNESKISSGNGVTIISDKSTRYRMHFRADSVSDDGFVRIGQIYFPGWLVIVDGERIAPEVLLSNLTEHGAMRLPVSKGSHLVEAWYEGPPGWRWRTILSILALLVIPTMVVLLHRLEKSG